MSPEKKHQRQQQRDIRRASFLSKLRANFLTGMIVVAPVFVTAYLMWWFVGLIDGFVLPLVPARYQPEPYLGIDVKGYGVIVFFLFTIFVGSLAKGFIGRAVLNWAESIVDRMPVVRSVYNALKQILETVLSQSESSLERAPCLVEYPRKGIWAVAFVSTDTKGEVLQKLPSDEPFVSVFLPTTPNPTSGFLLFVPKKDVIMLDMDVEAAAKLVISGGLINPPSQAQILAAAAKAAESPAAK
jgi:uncharacterized membrane protein